MADECTDVANNEQFVICIRWVDNTLTDHEDVIGLYNVGIIDSGALVTTMKDVLLCMSLRLTQCCGQCYDGVDVKKQLNYVLAMEKRAVLTHCYGYALNLAVGDSMKQSKVCIDALDAEAFGQCALQDGQCEEMLLKVSLNTQPCSCGMSALRHSLTLM